MHSIGTPSMWLGFLIFVLAVICIDIFLLGRNPSHKVSIKEALSWVLVWFSCAVIFALLLCMISKQRALEFFTGYMIEESLAIDNMFVFLMIFNYFHVPAEYQRRVLLYGVLSAIGLRFLMIIGGTWLVREFHWILYIFGAFLIFTGIKLFSKHTHKVDLGENPIVIWLRRHLRVTEQFHAENFFVKQRNKWYVTPLFLVLILIEISDIVFALDSIPAIFAVTNDAFVIFTSNVFAILGLRALYFLLANMADRFSNLKYGVAFILVFIGTKMIIAPWIDIPIVLTLSIIVFTLGFCIWKK